MAEYNKVFDGRWLGEWQVVGRFTGPEFGAFMLHLKDRADYPEHRYAYVKVPPAVAALGPDAWERYVWVRLPEDKFPTHWDGTARWDRSDD